jgi:hypothetical protein
MTSSISSEYETWHVSNRTFWWTLHKVSEVGKELAKDETELAWAERLSEFDESKAGTYSPDVGVEELFSGPKEANFWADVLFDLADRIYQRTIGNQDAQDWQIETIWAAYDLGLLLRHASTHVWGTQHQPEG